MCIFKTLRDNFIIASRVFNELCKAGIATSPPVITSAKRNIKIIKLKSRHFVIQGVCSHTGVGGQFRQNVSRLTVKQFFSIDTLGSFLLRLYLRRAKRGCCISLFAFFKTFERSRFNWTPLNTHTGHSIC